MPNVTLAGRLLLALGFLAIVPTAVVGVLVRDAIRDKENQHFQEQVQGAQHAVDAHFTEERKALHDLLRPLCEHDAFVDKTLVDLQAGRLDSGRRLALAQLVPDEMKALRLDELVLVTGSGEVLGAGHDPALVGVKDRAYAQALAAADKEFAGLRRPSREGSKPLPAAIVARCVRKSGNTRVGLIGARHLGPLLDRMGEVYGVRLGVEGEPGAAARPNEETTRVQIDPKAGVTLVVATSRAGLDEALQKLDRVMLVTGGATLAVAILLAFVLARSLSNPLAQLSQQVGEVVDGEPRELPVRGTKEMRTLAIAFNKTLHDLVVLRRRHAAIERIAAWREVARRVAHEINNPLTPIRSSIETLRRLKARDDPKFDDYFDEATKGILEDVHRIASIASDFARFARLPPPKPAPLDVVEVARTTVAMHSAEGVPIELRVTPCPELNADRDQLAQMLTNLLQNAMDAARSHSAAPQVTVLVDPHGSDHVCIRVQDNGPGVPEDLLPRLFEPYVTTKAHGTGLGLPIVQRIVIEHGGEIRYEAGAQGGACFVVLLPRSAPVAAPDSSPHV